MNSLSARRLFWSASAALIVVLAAAPAVAVQTEPASQAVVEKIDLNTASQASLESLPGVDAATAKQIIAGRPYGSVADLSKAGVSASTIEQITPLVKVGPLGKAAVATEKGAQKAAAGVGKGAEATAKGVEKGVSEGAKGVQKGAAATSSAADKVNRKLTGAARVPPQAGMVWANSTTKVYHKEGDPSYGTTKKGKWLTEEEAVKQGYRAAKLNAVKEK
ncbi:MAG TPA: helix-hairpin-helix domain-containing protein [Vicinamibacterales bacterium]|jgi:hypothetical protein